MQPRNFVPALASGAIVGAALGIVAIVLLNIAFGATLTVGSLIFAAAVGAVAGLVLGPLMTVLPRADGARDASAPGRWGRRRQDMGRADTPIEGAATRDRARRRSGSLATRR
jgi:hypothetical protein